MYKNVSVIGLGRLGLPFAFFLAAHGKKVFAYDNNIKLKKNILKNKKNVEPYLNYYIKKNIKNFFFEHNLKNIIHKTNITFLVLPTPSKINGSFSNTYIFNCLKNISKELKLKKNTNHSIVITSTVSPGSCSSFIQYLEKKGLKNKKDFSIIYNPHFIAQGTTIANLEKPDLLLLGTDSENSQKKINKFYQTIYKKNKIFKNTNFLEGEISKISINCFITTKISFSNYISEICENYGNADAKKVLDVIGKDSRINHSYMKVGTKFSGPCFPRDNKALISYSKKIGIKSYLPQATNSINNFQSSRLLNILKKITNNKLLRLGIFGLTYKTGTNLILDSQSHDLLQKIKKTKIKFKTINIFDSFLKKEEIIKYNNNLNYFKNIKDFSKNSDIIILSYPHDSDKYYSTYNPSKIKYLIDCWRRVDSVRKKIKLIRFGTKNF